MIQYANGKQRKDMLEMREWIASRILIPGLTLADREFARLVAVTVCVMNAWELNMLGGRPIMWKRLPLTVLVRPEWNMLSIRYGYGEKQIRDLCIVEARKIMAIPSGNEYA